MLNAQKVSDAYELILGRTPENDQVVQDMLQVGTTETLSRVLISSEEFEARYVQVVKKPAPQTLSKPLSPSVSIETTVEPHILSQLFDKTAGAWEKLGNEDAYWSVLTHDEFRKEVLPQNMDAFEASSEDDLWMIRRGAELAARSLDSFENFVELGCGVGRVTKHAAPLFNRYTAIDISAPHLKLAEERTDATSARFLHLKKPSELETLPRFDFFFSRLVLQHNPPPVIGYMLRTILEKLADNGIALFQVPTYYAGYAFNTRGYLEQKSAGMEMHVFPQPEILKIAREHGCDLLSLQQDRDTGDEDLGFISHTFLFRKQSKFINKIKNLFL